MEPLLVTCPETGRREEIGGVIARDGEMLVVLQCTRFDPVDAVTCAAACVHCPTHPVACDRWRMPALAR